MHLPLRCLLPALVLAVLWSGDAAAHPHVFIQYDVTVSFDQNAVPALRFNWTFDEMYSSVLRNDNVKSTGAHLSDEDVQRLRDNAFANLANFNYFLDLWVDGEPYKVTEIADFGAALRGKSMIYSFTVPIKRTPKRPSSEFQVIVFDNEYFVDFTLAEAHPVTVEHGKEFAAKCQVYRDVERPSELGPVNSDVVKCSWHPKS
jgi:ABC-type uncharacterized transport system substrate-binding protein